MVCSVGSSILCVTLTKVSLTRLGGYVRGIDYIRRIYSVHRVQVMNTLMNYSSVVRLYIAV